MKAEGILNGKVLAVEERHLNKLLDLGELFGNPEQPEPLGYDIVDGVAVVHVRGMVSHGLSDFERWWLDAFDTDEIAGRVREAVGNPNVRAVVLDVNSPGGMVVGTPELAEIVRKANAEKPVIAHTSSLMASAAYWISSGAEKVLATASAEVGSIGCYAIHYDLSAMHAMTGVRPVVFRSGDQKAAGVAGTKLTPDQTKDIAEGVEAVGREFRKAVKEARPGVVSEALDGRVFTGTAAVEMGLADGISDLAGAVGAAREAADKRERENMELEQEVARLKGELDAANGLLAEADKTAKESAVEVANARENVAKAQKTIEEQAAAIEAAKAEAARLSAELDATKATLAEKEKLLAAAPSALQTAGTKPVAGLFDPSEKTANSGDRAEWDALVKEVGYEKAVKTNPELHKRAFGFE